jgi:hypothetical protein
MLDQTDGEDNSDPSPDRLHGTYPPQFDQMNPATTDFYRPSINVPPQMGPPQPNPDVQGGPFGNDMIDPNDPMLDADPFGLSASMHYPTAYSFEQSAQR